jgi:hypothetical protein
MEVRSGIRKPLFSGQLTLKKMINRIFYLNNPPNDPSSSEYYIKRLLNFETVKLYPAAGYLTPRKRQVKSVLPIVNPPRNFRILNQIRAPLSPPWRTPKLAKSLHHFLRSPRATRGKQSWKWRPRNLTRKMGKGRRRSHHLGSGFTVSAPTTNS